MWTDWRYLKHGMDFSRTSIMKKIITIVAAACLIGSVFGIEIAPIEKAREMAALITGQVGKLANAPFAMQLNLDEPQAVGANQRGGIVIPVKGLSAKQIAGAGAEVVPLGMLWFKGMMPSDGAVVVPDEENVRSVQMRADDKMVTVHPFFAGVRKGESGRLELVLFGKSSKEPYLTARLLPLPSRQEVPIELAVYGGDDTGAILLLSFLGKYQAEIKIVPHDSPEEPVAESYASSDGGKAAKAAGMLQQYLNQFAAKHVKIKGDVAHADLFEKNDVAALIIPDKDLSAELLAGVGKTEVPVGQLWLKSLSPEVDGSAAAEGDLKFVKVSKGDESMELPQFLLTAQRSGKALKLLFYSGTAKPLLSLPLEEFETGHSLPIELEGESRDGSSGLLSFYVLGKYHAKMIVRLQ